LRCIHSTKEIGKHLMKHPVFQLKMRMCPPNIRKGDDLRVVGSIFSRIQATVMLGRAADRFGKQRIHMGQPSLARGDSQLTQAGLGCFGMLGSKKKWLPSCWVGLAVDSW